MGSSGGLYGQEVEGGTGDVVGPSSSTDNALARFDSTTGKLLQNGVVTESDTGALAGVTQLDIDNLRLDGNTLSATNANGNLDLAPNGTGQVRLPDGAITTPGLAFTADPDCGIARASANDWYLVADGAGTWSVVQISGATSPGGTRIYNSDNSGQAEVGNGGGQPKIQFGVAGATDGYSFAGDEDTACRRAGADSLALRAGGVDAAVAQGALGSVSAGLLALRQTEPSTAGSGSPNLLATSESRKLITNEGAVAEAYNTLPASAPIGYEQSFYCKSTNGIRITAPAGCTIGLSPTQVSASGGFVRSTVLGSGCTLVKISATEFVAVNAPNGTWTVDI